LYIESRSHTYGQRGCFHTHVRAAVPAIEQHFEALGCLDTEDIDIAYSIPQSSPSLGIISVETYSCEDASALSSATPSITYFRQTPYGVILRPRDETSDLDETKSSNYTPCVPFWLQDTLIGGALSPCRIHAKEEEPDAEMQVGDPLSALRDSATSQSRCRSRR
jgi:hypothetical protein